MNKQHNKWKWNSNTEPIETEPKPIKDNDRF
jgi:hypothetical protein